MDAQATFSCSFTQSDLGPVAELAQPAATACLAGPEAATPGTAGSGCPSARWCSTSLGLGPGT